MGYLTRSEVKDAIAPAGKEAGDYYEVQEDAEFDSLLDRLIEDSQAVIDDELMGESLEEETDRVDELAAPDKRKLPLAWPINNVSKVELWRGDEWHTLDSSNYNHTAFSLQLDRSAPIDGRINSRFRGRNPLKFNTAQRTWKMMGDKVKVTYDRGFGPDESHSDPIPQNVKAVNKELIRKMLTKLRQDQNLAHVDPDEVSEIVNGTELLTEEMRTRLNRITQPKNKYVTL